MDKYRVPIKLLKNRCSPLAFDFKTTDDIPASREIIGQERAMEALKFGLSIKKKGYNIYISGLTGTGRNSYSYIIAKEVAKEKETPRDWCYVFNFKKPECPKAISFEAGKGKILKDKMSKVISNIKIDIPKSLESKDYEENKNIIYSQYQKKAQDVIEELNKMAKDYNFVFKQTDKGILSVPIIDGRPMTDAEFDKLSEDELEKLKELSNELGKNAYDYVKKIREIENGLRNEIRKLKEKKVSEVVSFHIDPLIYEFNLYDELVEYFYDMKEDIIENFDIFFEEEEIKLFNKKEDFLKRYEVNLLIDNSNLKGAPVVKEMNPNYYNLFGKIEYANELGGLKTDHTKIKPGSLHEANGGYLIVQAKDLLQNKLVWDTLKRSILAEKITVENITGLNIISETLKPEAIPLDVKIIIIGDYLTYHLMYIYDDDFKKLFKIRSDFDIEMERNEENIKKISSFVAYQCKEQGLRPFDISALSSIIELSSRIAEYKNKLTAKFNELVEIIYEADEWANINDRDIVTREDVETAIDRKIYRSGIFEEKIQELIKDEILLIDTFGWKIGEINGLAIIDLGQYSFGRPNKITVNTFLGKNDIINIEREVEQSGNIYDKGVMILSGYLGEKYAKNNHLSLTASITFEQSYDVVDGDSASSAELYALLSSLSNIPINQAIAVTGSINQKGMVQPIGGVNEKIEGYYKICKIKGFKGGEGVIIPYKNIDNLMLSDEVIEGVKNDMFNIYAVKTVDEGIEILTGIPAGEKNERGEYPEGTVNFLVQEKLNYYSDLSKEYD